MKIIICVCVGGGGFTLQDYTILAITGLYFTKLARIVHLMIFMHLKGLNDWMQNLGHAFSMLEEVKGFGTG